MSTSSQYQRDPYIEYAPGSGWIVFAASMLGIVGVWNTIEGLVSASLMHEGAEQARSASALQDEPAPAATTAAAEWGEGAQDVAPALVVPRVTAVRSFRRSWVCFRVAKAKSSLLRGEPGEAMLRLLAACGK